MLIFSSQKSNVVVQIETHYGRLGEEYEVYGYLQDQCFGPYSSSVHSSVHSLYGLKN